MKVVIIGSGNIAAFFGIKMYEAGWNIIQVVSKNATNAQQLAQHFNTDYTNQANCIKQDADLYILAVNDNALVEFENISWLSEKQVIYTAGSITIDKVKAISTKIACIWPIYSIQKNNLPTSSSIPLVITHSEHVDKTILHKLANTISSNLFFLSEIQKQNTHLAAVIANNFSNHLYTLAKQVLDQNNIPFELLLPLIQNTTEKLMHSSPEQNQTGPAIRHDGITISHQIEILNQNKNLQDIYKILTLSIQQYYTRLKKD